jgi:DNA-directed RNA polymerase subunit M/transcription elongation factor TFIIS
MRSADTQERTSGRLCPRCHQARMVEVLTIAPVVHEPGLIAYECTGCGHVTSDLQPPSEP